ncbi:MAG: hypothetical protein KAI66_19290, partial [Lentisphaeria bacterium]|nr:hypothetical protein [Lentisphaeria bacterium]
MVGIAGLGALALSGGCASAPRTGTFPPFEVRVEIEETAFPYPAYKVTNNGSGMFWGSGSAHLVRIGGKLFASAFEHVPGCAPLNNARWALYERTSDGWRLCQRDEKDRTREPSPLAVSHDGQLIMSVNPTLVPWVDAPPDVSGTKMAKRGGDVSHKWRGGPARPELLKFDPARPAQPPVHLLPEWEGEPKFTEHSYRTFTADGENGEFLLLQNIGVGLSEWVLWTKDHTWKTGRFFFVKRTVDPAYTPYHGKYARVNYPNVMLRNREVHFVGHSAYNIWNRIDPKKAETWGRANWGGRFREIHYAWTPDITTTPLTEWTTVDDTMDDGGTLNLGDSWLAPDGRVHVVWTKNPIHPRLRDKHFPDIKRDRQLWYGVLRKGQLLEKRVLASGGDTTGSLWPEGKPRFHITPKHELYILYSVRGVSKETQNLTGSYAIRIAADGTASPPIRIPLEQPFTGTFFTTTPRGGNRLSETAELLIGGKEDGQTVMRYARLRFLPPS